MAQAPLTLKSNPLESGSNPPAPPAPEAPKLNIAPAAADVSKLQANLQALLPAKKPPVALLVNSLKQAQAVFNRWHVTVEADRDPNDLKDPAVWAHMASKLRPLDRITVDWEDGSRWMELRVYDAGPNWAKVMPYDGQELEPRLTREVSIGNLKVGWGGLSSKYRVIRSGDNAVLKDGMATMGEAVQFAEQHIRAEAR
jgi:hypothetical protein